MTYFVVSKVLEELILQLRAKGVPISSKILNDLKSARVLIKILNANESNNGENATKIEEYLSNVEANLITLTQKHFPEKVDYWLKKIETAACDSYNHINESSKFITGLPRDQKWVRITPLNSLPLDQLIKIADTSNISHRVEKNGQLLVYGDLEKLKFFLKRINLQKQ